MLTRRNGPRAACRLVAIAALAGSVVTACSSSAQLAGAPSRATRSITAPGKVPPSDAPVHSTPTTAQAEDSATAASRLVAAMPLEEQVGALLLPQVYGSSATSVTPAQAAANRALLGVDTPAEAVARFHLAGFTLIDENTTDPVFASLPTGNVLGPTQLQAFTSGLQSAAVASGAKAPLLLALDQEGGSVERLTTGATFMPAEQAFGAAGDASLVRDAGVVTGEELGAVGVNVELAPVADVTARPGNTVIGTRSYGSDPAAVSRLVAADVTGIQSAGIAATVKHFPGHGNTDVDSHLGLPVLTQSAAELSQNDLPPFRAAIRAGVDLVMVGHLSIPALDTVNPSSLSPAVVTDLLRRQLGFTGVVVTDALGMGAIRERYGAGESAILAVAAGDDLLGMPANTVEADAALLSAVRSGRLPRSTIVAAATRVMRLRLTLAKSRPSALSTVGSVSHLSAADRAARAGLTLISASCRPVQLQSARVAGPDAQGVRLLSSALSARGVLVGSGPLVTVVGGNDSWAAAQPSDVTVSVGTPYVLSSSTAPVRLASYGDDPASIAAVADFLVNRGPASGQLPVPVPGARSCGPVGRNP
jgi:beta-N-acetylhexosaminidase